MERLTRYSSQTRTTAWKEWLDRDHSCRRLIRAIFHGKLSTDQRRKMKKVFFLTALTCANIPSIPSRLEATLEIILEKERREERPFRSSLSHLIEENRRKSFFDFILKFTATSLQYGQHSSSLSLHDSRLLGNSINQAAISRDNN